MKITVEREKLLGAMDMTAPRARGSSIEVLKHLLFSTTGDKLTITGNDTSACCSVSIPAEVEVAGDTAVPAVQFHGLVKRLAKGSQVRLILDPPLLRVECGSAKYQFPTLLAADMPRILETQTAHAVDLTGADVVALFQRPAIAVCTDETRYFLAGIYLHSTDGKLVSVATDGHNLLRFKSVQAFNGAKPVIVSSDFLPEFSRVGQEGGTLAWSETLISLRTESAVFTSKLVDGTYPDYERLIPEDNGSHLDVDREELIAACERLSIVNDSRLVKLAWDRDPDTLHVSVDHAGIEHLRCSATEMGAGETRLFPKKTCAILGALRGEIVRLSNISIDAPIRFTDMSDPDVIALSMPGRYGKE